MKKTIIVSGLLLAFILLMAGCSSEIATPTTPPDRLGQVVKVDDAFTTSIADPTPPRSYYVYLPPNYDETRPNPYPVLILMNGFFYDETYFISYYSVLDAADYLYSRGEIEEMVIVMPSGYSAFGGSFYTNSPHPMVGNSMTHIDDIRAEVAQDYNVSSSPADWAISGHSMGGYGALSIAMSEDYADHYGSVSSMSGPVYLAAFTADLNGSGSPDLIDQIYAIIGYAPSANGGDYDRYNFQYLMTEALAKDVRIYRETAIIKMIFAMAAAFSPMDPGNPQLTSFPAFVDSVDLSDVNNPLIYYSSDPAKGIGVDMPIGWDGQLDMPTFARFLEHDPGSLIQDPAFAARVASKPIFLMNGMNDPLVSPGIMDGFSQVYNLVFGGPNLLETEVRQDIPTPTGDINSGHSEQVYEWLKDILRWHSDQFQTL